MVVPIWPIVVVSIFFSIPPFQPFQGHLSDQGLGPGWKAVFDSVGAALQLL